MKLVKYFLQKRAVTILLLVLVLAGGLFSYFKMGKLEDVVPFTIKQALVLTSYPGASPAEVQSQVTDICRGSYTVARRTLLSENQESCRTCLRSRFM